MLVRHRAVSMVPTQAHPVLVISKWIIRATMVPFFNKVAIIKPELGHKCVLWSICLSSKSHSKPHSITGVASVAILSSTSLKSISLRTKTRKFSWEKRKNCKLLASGYHQSFIRRTPTSLVVAWLSSSSRVKVTWWIQTWAILSVRFTSQHRSWLYKNRLSITTISP